MPDEPLPRQRVAVTVFADVEAVDARDGAHILEMALLQLGVYPTEVVRVTFPGWGGMDVERDVRIHRVMDAGQAVGNGYMWLEPTWKAFPRDDKNLT